MADIWSKKKRSEVMSLIRSRGNKATEIQLIVFFREYGIRGWRRNQKLFGKPDFVFPKEKLIVFVDGCFWHCCPKCYRRPTSKREYWDAKALRNKTRDLHVTRTLRSQGWRVLRIWEHSLKKPTIIVRQLKKALALRRNAIPHT
jgi:DNA mismatch endonuclease (patch repair protein)